MLLALLMAAIAVTGLLVARDVVVDQEDTGRAVRSEASEYLERIAQVLRTTGLTARTESAAGFVDEASAGLAHEHRADAIVMATRARRGLAGLILGSASVQAVRLATMPVPVVPPGRPPAGRPARRTPRTVRPRTLGAAGGYGDAGASPPGPGRFRARPATRS
jgi:nucleotide-binding universal stress UspA family protein